MDTPSPQIVEQLFEQIRARGFQVEIERPGKEYIVRVSNDIAEQSFRGCDLYDLARQIAFQLGIPAKNILIDSTPAVVGHWFVVPYR